MIKINQLALNNKINVLFSVFVFEHVGSYTGNDFFSVLVLTKVIHKISIWFNQVHYDGVVNL